MTRSALSPSRMRCVIAPIVAYRMTSLCPDVRWKTPAICLNTDCIAAADNSEMSAAAAGQALASNATANADDAAIRAPMCLADDRVVIVMLRPSGPNPGCAQGLDGMTV